MLHVYIIYARPLQNDTTADEDGSPGKNLKESFRLDEDGSATYRKDEEWGARILEADAGKKTMKLAVYIPGDCAIGEWDIKIKTALLDKEQDLFYVCPQPIVVLFNPWSSGESLGAVAVWGVVGGVCVVVGVCVCVIE